MELEDPVLGRKITHSNRIRTLPDRDKEAAMGFHKGHKEFHKLDLNEGWEKLPGYPDGIQQKIIAGALDKRANAAIAWLFWSQSRLIDREYVVPVSAS